NNFLTMLLGGIWHGASWTMVLWGAFHGTILILHRLLTGDRDRRRERERPALTRALQIFGMFQVTCLGWLIFRAQSVAQVGRFLYGIATDLRPSAATLGYAGLIAELIAPLLLFQYWQYRRGTLELFERWTAVQRAAFAVLLLWFGGACFVLHRSLVQGEMP